MPLLVPDAGVRQRLQSTTPRRGPWHRLASVPQDASVQLVGFSQVRTQFIQGCDKLFVVLVRKRLNDGAQRRDTSDQRLVVMEDIL